MKSKFNTLISQPHQPFFVTAVINAIIFMTIFVLIHFGISLSIDNIAVFHGYSMIFLLFTPFFLGFLLTTFPRFSQTNELSKEIYLTSYALLLIGEFLFILGSFVSTYILIGGYIFILLCQIYTFTVFYKIYQASPLPTLYDQKWIMIGFFSGIVSNTLFIISTFINSYQLSLLAIYIAIFLYLIIVSYTVGARMIPFFSHVMVQKNKKILPSLYALFSLMIIFRLFDLKIGFFFLFISSAILSKEIYSWKLPFKNSQPILWILHLGLFWLPMGLFLSSIALFYRFISGRDFIFLDIHLVMIGFLTTLMIGFGTRVTLGHSGNNMIVDKITKTLFYLTQIVLYFRVLYSLNGSPILFYISAILWIVLFISWSIKYLPVLIYKKRIT